MPRTSDARQRAIQTAIRLFQRQGYHGTGLAQILEESGAPKGSFYHHFPGGKEQLAVEAVRRTSAGVNELFAAATRRSADPVGLVRTLGHGLARWLESSGFEEGCPVAALTVETASSSEALQAACREAYTSWRQQLAGALAESVGDGKRSERLAALIVAGFEGALLLARAEGSVGPVESVAKDLAEHVRIAIDGRLRKR